MPTGRIVVYEDYEFSDRYVMTDEPRIFDTYKMVYVKIVGGASHGYPACYLTDVHGTTRSFLYHRIIAATWIGDVTGKEVHHIDHDRWNYSIHNLEILDIHEHGVIHNRGVNNNTARLTEDEVHMICKLLKDNVTHTKILEIMRGRGADVSLDTIDKISCGKNWYHISSTYGLKKETRETMNEFSDRQVEIGRMRVYEGLTVREIAERLGIEYKSKSYIRLVGCVGRYANKYYTGQYGLFRK